MSLIHNEHPVDQSFNLWISQYPESFHPLDLERFYGFVKCVCRYSRRPKGGVWLREKLIETPNLSEKDIETYCSKFIELQKFYKAPCIQVYEARYEK